MKRKSAIIVAILVMCIGFAAISTTLIINGSATVGENTDDFSVIFTKATLDGIEVYANVIDDTKKIITFETNDLKTLNQTSVLTYEVTNNSANYDAEVQVNCKVKDDAEAKYTSIKNELEGNVTVVKAKETINGTLTVTLNKTATEEVKEEYVCELTFNAVERDMVGVAPINLYNMIKDSADTTTIIDYSIRSGADGKETNGIYTTTATEGNVPVYYYRGKVDNNIIFGDYCWKIIRTTETGGIKLIYNGTPTDGKCDNMSYNSISGLSAWNTTYDDAAYVGYMFGINNTGNSTSKEEAQTNTYDSTIKAYLEDWFKSNMLAYENYLENIIYCNDRRTVEGGNNNTLKSNYGTLGYGKNATGYAAIERVSSDTLIPKPEMTCANANDSFSFVDSKNGNKKLKYSIGLITLDEAVLAGFNTYASSNDDFKDTTNYLYNGLNFWTMTPIYVRANDDARVGIVDGSGNVGNHRVSFEDGVRPVISLKSGILIEPTGDGTTTNPYVVK